MLNRHRTKIIYILLLLALTLPSRLTHIDAAVNIDEPWWVISSSNFYYAVTHRDFQDTYFEYHPGVTNMWVISTAMLVYFPEYRGFGQGFFDQRKPFYEEFLRENGKETIELVRYARYIQAGVLAVFAVMDHHPGRGKSRLPETPVAKPGHEADLKKRTLTNLYNPRPAWLDLAHKVLDKAVAAAYGWADYTPEMPDEELLRRLWR